MEYGPNPWRKHSANCRAHLGRCVDGLVVTPLARQLFRLSDTVGPDLGGPCVNITSILIVLF
jgi:hypothetical protein